MTRGSTTLRVRYGETDQMGVAYHPNYLAWCEIGRTELMRELGLPYAEMESHGTLLAVAEVNVRYSVAAHYDDLVRIETWVEAIKSRTVTFGYEIHRVEPDPARLARASTTLISIGRDHRPRTLPPEVRELLQA